MMTPSVGWRVCFVADDDDDDAAAAGFAGGWAIGREGIGASPALVWSVRRGAARKARNERKVKF